MLLKDFMKTIIQNRQLYEPVSFLVLAIERYKSDFKHHKLLKIQPRDDSPRDVIQLTLTDEMEKVKVMLDSKLNFMVQKNQIQAGSVVHITDCVLYQSEEIRYSKGVVIVKDLKVTELKLDWNHKDWSVVQWWSENSEIIQINGHLTSSRCYYLSVWTSYEMYGNEWTSNDKPVQDGIHKDEASLTELKELPSKKSPNPAVLVRVLMKCRLHHYAKPHQDAKWPFRALFLVGDGSRVAQMILWSRMCCKWYYQLSVGDVLLIRNFLTKPVFKQIPQEKIKKVTKDLTLVNLELSVNPDFPAAEADVFYALFQVSAEVTMVNPGSVSTKFPLPPVVYEFASRKVLGYLPDDTVKDVIGVVVYVGRYEREPTISGETYKEDSGAFWIRQWIYLRDGTSHLPIKVKLFHAAIGLSNIALKPGIFLMCSNVRVLSTQITNKTSRSPRSVCVTSTSETEVRILAKETESLVQDDPVVIDLVDWSKSDDYTEVMENCHVGGYCQGLPLPYTNEDVLMNMSAFPPVPSDQWQEAFTSFCYREHRPVAIHTLLVSIEYHSRSLKGDPRKQPKCTYTVHDMFGPNQNINDIDSLGSESLDAQETFPAMFVEDRWQELKQKLDFPCMNLEGNSYTPRKGPFEVNTKPYFTFVWRAVNERKIIYTHMICDSQIHMDTTILDILSGQPVTSEGDKQGPGKSVTSNQEMLEVMETGSILTGKIMYAVFDCYQYASNKLEIMVNRAFCRDS